MKKRGRPAAGVLKDPSIKTINHQEKKDLKTLADDFKLLSRKDTQKCIEEIIANCKSYAEGQRAIMRVYTAIYMQ